ncbi:hypothetical protein IC006_2178 [Sulfuracidifex tepidarius]|uniref:Uncharacterized protein n=2 Tax=Sulfuracidifex tepidarius TaxID=1294262 RepID=A0A510DXB7_9CREN|nr:hypothetical protein IC006_2178 [Sulfuracidifex tepidarius]
MVNIYLIMYSVPFLMKSEIERVIIVALLFSVLILSSSLTYLYDPPGIDGVGVVEEGAFSLKVSMFLVNYDGEPFNGYVRFSSSSFNETVSTDNGSVVFMYNETTVPPLNINVTVFAQGTKERFNLSSLGTYTFAISPMSAGHYQSRDLSYVLIRGENISASLSTVRGDEQEGVFTIKNHESHVNGLTDFALPVYFLLACTLTVGGVISFFQFIPFPRGQMDLLKRIGKGMTILTRRLFYTTLLMAFSSAVSFITLSNSLGLVVWDVLPFVVFSLSFFLTFTGVVLIAGRRGVKYSPLILSYMLAGIFYHEEEIELLLAVLISITVLGVGIWRAVRTRPLP